MRSILDILVNFKSEPKQKLQKFINLDDQTLDWAILLIYLSKYSQVQQKQQILCNKNINWDTFKELVNDKINRYFRLERQFKLFTTHTHSFYYMTQEFAIFHTLKPFSKNFAKSKYRKKMWFFILVWYLVKFWS